MRLVQPRRQLGQARKEVVAVQLDPEKLVEL